MGVLFSLAPIFTDHMVLQSERTVPIWGTAPDGEIVTVELHGQRKSAKSVMGKWRVNLAEMQAGGPFEVKISCAGNEILLKNVMAGEVWIAGGQSNMFYPLVSSRDGYLEIPAADYPGIRFYAVPPITHENMPEDPAVDAANAVLVKNTHWKVCSPANAGNFYAIAFHFAKELHRSLGVPVGIIECAWNGTSASCWMGEEWLSLDPDTKVYLDEYLDRVRGLSWDEYMRACRIYDEALDDYGAKIKDVPITYEDMEGYFDRINGISAYPWPPAFGPASPLRPCGLYHTMFRKITPFGVRGVIFYQGETDIIRPAVYGKLFGNMMKNWRQDLENPDLPFIITQLSANANGNDSGIEYALVREQQYRLAMQPNCALAVSIDCGHRTNVHPVDKKTVGERLAVQAKAKVYGLDVPYLAPEFKEMEIAGDCALISFNNVYGGLEYRGELEGFQIAGEDRKFVPGVARIMGSKVAVSAKGIEKPVAIRYGFVNYARVTLYNSEGFAATPFRTDDWKQ